VQADEENFLATHDSKRFKGAMNQRLQAIQNDKEQQITPPDSNNTSRRVTGGYGAFSAMQETGRGQLIVCETVKNDAPSDKVRRGPNGFDRHSDNSFLLFCSRIRTTWLSWTILSKRWVGCQT
jgi:hypothetical protein